MELTGRFSVLILLSPLIDFETFVVVLTKLTGVSAKGQKCVSEDVLLFLKINVGDLWMFRPATEIQHFVVIACFPSKIQLKSSLVLIIFW